LSLPNTSNSSKLQLTGHYQAHIMWAPAIENRQMWHCAEPVTVKTDQAWWTVGEDGDDEHGEDPVSCLSLNS